MEDDLLNPLIGDDRILEDGDKVLGDKSGDCEDDTGDDGPIYGDKLEKVENEDEDEDEDKGKGKGKFKDKDEDKEPYKEDLSKRSLLKFVVRDIISDPLLIFLVLILVSQEPQRINDGRFLKDLDLLKVLL